MTNAEIQDVIIVGAGISGISAACHLHKLCPEKRYTILEARNSIGGTWDLFRYPGIRSDSDMLTFGFNFKPWTNPKALADGPSILSYLRETIEEYGVEKHIQFGLKVTSAAWDSSAALWTVSTLSNTGEVKQVRGRLLFMCSGYYDYEAGYTPDLPGLDEFEGKLVHPQHWPEDLDYRGKKIAVIGSGATAVTLVPAMVANANHITMIQRSPTYIVSMPEQDRLYKLLCKILPETWAYSVVRWRNIRFQNHVYRRSRNDPQKMKAWLLSRVNKALKDDIDVATHFTPSYDPWTQRMCLVPDSDLFHALNSGKAEVCTAQIERITQTGVRLDDGSTVECDILITATGLQLQFMGDVKFFQDGEAINFPKRFMYHGMMFSNVPNLIQTFGYVNASWTLRADLNSRFVCDLLKKMDATQSTRVVPVLSEDEQNMHEKDWMADFNPGYIQRAMHLFPRQGDQPPWHNTQNYLLDRKLLRHGPVNDGVLQFLGNTSTSKESLTESSVGTEQAA
ncbi:MAG: NAD(P)/FAD-dependent oxidoreductase [Gammaproteobacteria bacterium]|nr:NAD(P)/FAD-dependent oxidoreductase [Gammaproteobacteria bacterium]MCY4358885.1 NAD(P)/FAD-dependent oxidoreductase [Gammaproteobacteria bacterium]